MHYSLEEDTTHAENFVVNQCNVVYHLGKIQMPGKLIPDYLTETNISQQTTHLFFVEHKTSDF